MGCEPVLLAMFTFACPIKLCEYVAIVHVEYSTFSSGLPISRQRFKLFKIVQNLSTLMMEVFALCVDLYL